MNNSNMRSITEIALEKYPPKGMSDSQDWVNDENALLRKAFIQGYEHAVNELIKSINPSHDERMKRMLEEVNAQQVAVNTAMKDAMESLTTRVLK